MRQVFLGTWVYHLRATPLKSQRSLFKLNLELSFFLFSVDLFFYGPLYGLPSCWGFSPDVTMHVTPQRRIITRIRIESRCRLPPMDIFASCATALDFYDVFAVAV
jgi:hypothetical protein